MNEELKAEKLKVTAGDLNAINKVVYSPTLNSQCVYVGSLRDAFGYHSSKIILYICQFLCNANIYISVLRNGEYENLRIRRGESQILSEHDSSKLLLVKNVKAHTYDVYITGSYGNYYTKGFIYIQNDPTIAPTTTVGGIVDVSTLTTTAEFLIKELPLVEGGH